MCLHKGLHTSNSKSFSSKIFTIDSIGIIYDFICPVSQNIANPLIRKAIVLSDMHVIICTCSILILFCTSLQTSFFVSALRGSRGADWEGVGLGSDDFEDADPNKPSAISGLLNNFLVCLGSKERQVSSN